MATTATSNAYINSVEAFRSVLLDSGLQPDEVIADGKIRRCGTSDKPKSKNGFYVLYDDPPAGGYGDWGTGLKEKWSLNGESIPLSEWARIRKEIVNQKAEREKEIAEKHRLKASEAQRYLSNSPPATGSNPYLNNKSVKPCPGLVVDGDNLIVPVLSPENNRPMSYQRINPDGSKRFMPEARVAGGYFPIKGSNEAVLIAEGIATALSLYEATGLTVLAAFSAGNLEAVAGMVRERYPDRQLIICADDDAKTAEKTGMNPGIEAANKAAQTVNSFVAVPSRPGDFNDLHAAEGTIAVKAVVDAAKSVGESQVVQTTDWPEPIELPDGLKPVAAFDYELLPVSIRPWAKDIADRMQCPPDYVAATIMAALGAVIGRRIGIRPQARTDWTVTPNFWGMLIGRPGLLKSPAMEAALGPLKALSAAATEKYQGEIAEHETAQIVEKLRKEAAEKCARVALKKDPSADISNLLEVEQSEPPVQKRYMANDTTAAALGELHRLNPNGLMIFRDELVSLLKMLDREENSEARGFYLTGWNGDSPYTFDRITRGMNLYIPAVCLSVIGSTQPARITQYVKAAVMGTAGDDGLIQRFGMVVWPDSSSEWRDVDRWPDAESKRGVHQVFDQLDNLEPNNIGAEFDTNFNGDPSGIPYLRFDAGGLQLFREWRTTLEKTLRSGDLHPAMESHLAKYRKLVPGLALIIHLASGGKGSVTHDATLRALAWGEYLQTHAERLYASVTTPDAATARKILSKIRTEKLPEIFKIRDVYRPKWTGLTGLPEIKAGIKLLVDHDWLLENVQSTGGRPAIEYHLNPRTEVLG